MIKGIAGLIVALNGNVKKTQVAAGFAWGLLFALVPSGNAAWFLLFTLSFFFRHNQGAKILVMAILKLFMPLLNPLVDELGWNILNYPSLYQFFTTLYNTPFIPFTKFNNTLVAGGLATGVVLWLPVFVLMVLLIPLYRNSILPKILDSKIARRARAVGKKIPLVQKLAGAVTTISNLRDMEII
jgi:uncharacterized protein (TIGR03546 family)